MAPNLQSPPQSGSSCEDSDWSAQPVQASNWPNNNVATSEADNMIKGPATFCAKLLRRFELCTDSIFCVVYATDKLCLVSLYEPGRYWNTIIPLAGALELCGWNSLKS